MLPPDIVQLKQFYASRLGERVCSLITNALLNLWPTAKGDAMLIIGYAIPFAQEYHRTATPLIICMPAEQGAAAWPPHEPNIVMLAHDAELPLQTNSINRVLLMHSIEHSEHLNSMMQEVWRVLVPGGRVLAVVPNRVSLWSGSAKTPFGYGRPFSFYQLRSLLTNHQFTITRTGSALFTPPFFARLSRRLSQKMEAIGRVCWWFMGGVLLVEAEKQLYASIKENAYAVKAQRLRVASRQPVGVGSKKI